MLRQFTDAAQENSGSPLYRQFGVSTVAGNLLVCAIAASIGNSTPPTVPVLAPPSTPGFTWTLVAQNTFQYEISPSDFVSEIVAVYQIANAPAMAASVQTECTITLGAGSPAFGFQLMEFDSAGAAVATVASSGYFTAPDAGPLVTPDAGLLLCFITDPQYNSEFSVGAGYTLIPIYNSGGVGNGYGDSQYRVIFSGGSYPTAFGSNIYGGWCMVAIAFGPGPSTTPPIPTATTGFTPFYPPITKQPFTLWGLEAKRFDSIAADGSKQSVLERLDDVTTLTFPFVALSDMAAWKAFESYALTGGVFTFLPILDYPNDYPVSSTIVADQMFQYPGTVSGETGCSLCQLVSMDWTPKFESPGIFSLVMKLRLVADEVGS
jgi:hypothetical protein